MYSLVVARFNLRRIVVAKIFGRACSTFNPWMKSGSLVSIRPGYKPVQFDFNMKSRSWNISNKKPTNWWDKAKQSRQTFSVITGILTVTEICAFMLATPVLRTFMQYLIAFYSQPETARDDYTL